jgi:hypothetical protein
MIGEPDAGKPHVRFDEGVQETCDIAARLRPTLPQPPIEKQPSYSGGKRGKILGVWGVRPRGLDELVD